MAASRYREEIATIFDVFCEIGAPAPGEKYAPLLTKYPDDFQNENILKSVRQFAFPCPMKQNGSDAVQMFSFVLTDSNSKYSFGFCRYTPRNDTCICFLSGFFWPNVFYKALNQLSIVMNSGTQSDVDLFLTRIYHTDIPNPGDILRFDLKNVKHDAKIPNLNKLPTLREEKYLLEFYNAVSPKQIVALYASLLKERRILFTGRQLSQLSSCIHACATILYPMTWQSVFIPVLPASLVDMIMAPMPYLIGVPKQIIEAAKLKDIGDVVIIDVDEKTLESPFDDVAEMPTEVVTFLKSQLKSTSDMSDAFARIFLRANVILFGDYRTGIVTDYKGDFVWKKDKFITEQRSTFQTYLSSLLGADGVQYLERFIHDRMEMFRHNVAIHDEFEREIEKMDMKSRVRENASDVIGALKDKMSGIQIANKLNKLTPREIRRAASRRISSGIDFQPMSFDNVQWEQARGEPFNESPVEPQPSDSVPVANLIDFDSPIDNNKSPPYLEEFLPNSSTSSSERPTSLPSQFNILKNGIFTDPFSLIDTPVTDGASSSSSRSQSSYAPVAPKLPAPRTAWEKFDD
ncbi:unnamed protein product [Caenorhabditis bovis]|uniref:UDENN domain-containing protein n=1 Tax=Caenorhabditis bovis TaxID=2654633 RepID=A0A8S1EFB1_9PELO|nr:unnamed protein product [Caenorhabditis bovis]